jgi:hypothetical protein
MNNPKETRRAEMMGVDKMVYRSRRGRPSRETVPFRVELWEEELEAREAEREE